MKFLPYDTSDFSAVKSLLDNAFDEPNQGENFSSIGKTEGADSYLRFVAKDGNAVIGYLGYAIRTMQVFGQTFAAASIGPVAVSPNVQQSGIGGFLMTETLKQMKLNGIEIVYIQGIPDYYQRFGFIKYLDKSKQIISTDANFVTGADNVKVVEDDKNTNAYRQLFEQYSSAVNFSSTRTERDWSWLLGPATNTYYFYQPRLIQNENGELLGYFCDDPYIDGSPRELVIEHDDKSVAKALEALKSFYRKRGCKTLEIKAPGSSRLAEVVEEMGCQKITYVNPRGGDLMLILDEYATAKKLAWRIPFILGNISAGFSAMLNCGTFSMTFGVAQEQPYFRIEPNNESSSLSLVHFMAGRINGDLLRDSRVTGFDSYKSIQNLLFSEQPGFVFQGDNM
jgi:putative acetyltransferase